MKVLIFGFFGVNNLGDDIMLQVFCNRILEQVSNANITLLLLYGSEINISLPQSVKVIKINKFKYGKSYLMKYWFSKRYDALFWIGGTCFTENAGNGAYKYMISFKMRNKKIGYIGVGIGQVTTPEKVSRYKHLLDIADVVTFRDKESYQTACKLSNNKNLHCCEDLVYLYAPAYQNNEIVPRNILVISWRLIEKYYNESIEEKAIDCICQFVVKHQQSFDKIIILPIGDRIDYGVNKRIYNILIKNIDLSHIQFLKTNCIDKKVQIIKEAKLFISGRLHGIFIAELNNINTIAVGYDNKIQRFLHSIDKETDIIYPDEITINKLEDIYLSRGTISKHLIKQRYELSEKNIEYFIQTIL